jgi:hypothetical protein
MFAIAAAGATALAVIAVTHKRRRVQQLDAPHKRSVQAPIEPPRCHPVFEEPLVRLVLGKLASPELVIAGRVCRSWQRIAHSRSLWVEAVYERRMARLPLNPVNFDDCFLILQYTPTSDTERGRYGGAVAAFRCCYDLKFTARDLRNDNVGECFVLQVPDFSALPNTAHTSDEMDDFLYLLGLNLFLVRKSDGRSINLADTDVPGETRDDHVQTGCFGHNGEDGFGWVTYQLSPGTMPIGCLQMLMEEWGSRQYSMTARVHRLENEPSSTLRLSFGCRTIGAEFGDHIILRSGRLPEYFPCTGCGRPAASTLALS